MIRVRMKRGHRELAYGEVYILPSGRAEVLVREGLAELIEEEATQKPAQERAVTRRRRRK